MFKNNHHLDPEMDESTGYRFDARLRYLENLMSALNIFIQSEAERRAKMQFSAPLKEMWRINLYNLYMLLKIQDVGLPEPPEDLNQGYINSLIFHKTIQEVTKNKLTKREPGEAILERFQY